LKPRFSKEQVAYALELVEAGVSVGMACRQLAMSEATLYKWRKKHGGTRRGYRRATPAEAVPGTIATPADASARQFGDAASQE
jgi:transposase-like protein